MKIVFAVALVIASVGGASAQYLGNSQGGSGLGPALIRTAIPFRRTSTHTAPTCRVISRPIPIRPNSIITAREEM
jgi:hypothetical protein